MSEHFDQSEFIKSSHKDGFFSYMFNLDEEVKHDILNSVQYTVLAIIPVTIILYFIRKYVPDPDDEKSSLVILAEIIIQLSVIVISLTFIDRLINYIPTFTGTRYHHMNVFNVIIGLLFVLLTIQTKLGEKARMLVYRAEDFILGDKNVKEDKQQDQAQQGQQQMSQQFNPLPPVPVQGPYSHPVNVNMRNAQGPKEQLPNYNKMYANTANPLINANTPGMENFEPMAANEALGGLTSFY